MTTTIRALSGIVTGGLVALALAVVTISIVGNAPDLTGIRGFPGPGIASILMHVGAAVGAVFVQVLADRKRLGGAFVGLLVVLAIAGAVLWTQWLN